MSEKRKVFVSYSRADKDKVLPLVKSLEKSIGTKFWIDLEGIESTAQFLNVIRQAIKDSQVVLFMLSDNSINGEWTQREIMFAKECGKRVVPVILDGGGLRDWTELYFANVNYVDGTNKRQIEKLSKEIAGWIEPEVIVEPPDNDIAATPPRSVAIKKVLSRLFASLKTIIVVAVTLIVILCVIGFCMGKDKEGQDKEVSIEDGQDKEVSIEPTYGTINGHAYVDLGLSVKWATCNVGASSPEDYGDYYAWGETSTESSYDGYIGANSKTYSNDTFNYDISGKTSLDAARANWGNPWRMPTKSEFEELLNSCTWTWTTLNGVKGYKVSSKKNGNSIFLPAAGDCSGTNPTNVGQRCYYWASTPYSKDAGYACYLYAGSDCKTGWRYRYLGQSVRPVTDF